MKLSHYKPLFAPASLFTISFLTFGLFVLLLVAAWATFQVLPPLWLALAVVIVMNIVMWLIGPWLNELFMRLIYDISWMPFSQFEQLHPERAARVEAICADNELATPKIGVIDDATPMAMTFGSDHWNARVVFSRGLAEILEPEEFDSVMAHELGHIRHRDFILMTIINTLLQGIFMVYLYCRVFAQRANDRAAAILAATAVASYVFYVLSTYLQLYVSRTREYKADSFAADYAGPTALSTALVKISYGLAREAKKEDEQLDADDGDGEAAAMTEKKRKYKDNIVGPMNIMEIDSDEDKNVAELVEQGQAEHAKHAMLYDAHSPWAKLSELHSTHPLTGNRIQSLEERHGASIFNLKQFASMHKEGVKTMKRTFWTDLKVLSVKYVGAMIGLIATAWLALETNLETSALLTGAGLTVLLFSLGKLVEYRWRFPSGEPSENDIGGLYTHFDASPVKGIPVKLDGYFLGRQPAGHKFSPDTTLRDETGFVPTIFASRLGWLGRLWKGWKHTAGHIGSDASVTGWYYRRGSNNHIRQRAVDATSGSWKSYPRFFFILKVGVFLFVAIGLLAAGVVI